MTLASALSNTSTVMLNTGTQYLGREFAVTSDAAQKASFEDLVTNLQKIFHRCKNETDRLNIAQKILTILGIIVSKQAPEERVHFDKIKGIALSALSHAGQTGDKTARAKYFQDKLILLLWAKQLMTACGQESQAGISYLESHNKFLEIFERDPSQDEHKADAYIYRIPKNDLSSLSLSIVFSLNYLCFYESAPKYMSLTRDDLLKIESYSHHEDAEVRQIANDYAIIRKRTAASKLYDQSIADSHRLKPLIASIKPCQSISAYYPAFVNYLDLLVSYRKEISLSELTKMNNLYEEHVTQLPAVHFAYRYFNSELTEACSLFSNRVDAMGYKKAYVGYEGTVLPSPEDFQSIIAVFPEPAVPVAVEEDKKEEKQPASNKKSKNTKSKKKNSPRKTASHPQQIKLENIQITTTTSSTSSSSSSSSATTAQETVAVNLKKDALPFKEIVYDSRVSLWFTNPADCLALPSYATLSEETQKFAIVKHTFPIALDQLLGTAYCVQESYQNSSQPTQVDTLFSIPGEIENVNSGKKIRGLFQYCISGKDKVCYHHYFKEMSTSELLNTDQYGKVFEEAEFPPLSSQSAYTTPTKKSADQELVYEPALDTYAVTDKSKGLTFRAFKIRTLT